MADNDIVTRETLIEARDRLREQIEIQRNPIRGYDRNPQLIAKLQAMLADVIQALNDTDGD
jgi:hypothetical protein